MGSWWHLLFPCYTNSVLFIMLFPNCFLIHLLHFLNQWYLLLFKSHSYDNRKLFLNFLLKLLCKFIHNNVLQYNMCFIYGNKIINVVLCLFSDLYLDAIILLIIFIIISRYVYHLMINAYLFIQIEHISNLFHIICVIWIQYPNIYKIRISKLVNRTYTKL